MATAAAAEGGMSEGWYIATGEGAPIGPYTLPELQAHYAGSYVTAETVLWREGQPAWLKLSQIPELLAVLPTADTATAPPASSGSTEDASPAAYPQVAGTSERTDAALGSGPVLRRPASRSATATAAAASTTAVTAPTTAASDNEPAAAEPDDPLAAFKAEISALEGEDGGGKAGSGKVGLMPEELSFVDDDGTLYVWDTGLNKYVAKGGAPEDAAASEAGAGEEAAAAPANEYDWQQMTFAAEEEVLPSLAAAKAAALGLLEDEAAAQGSSKGPTPGGKGGKGGAEPAAEAKADEAVGAKRSATAAGMSPEGTEAAGKETVVGPAPIIAGGKRSKKGAKPAPTAEQLAKEQAWFELKQNTSVYVTGLPDDATVEEVSYVFTKCGLIKEDDQHNPRIKLYRDAKTGMLKGDGLVTYLKEPSVLLATQILDGAQFRTGVGMPMTVTRAKFEMKGDAYVPKTRPGKSGKKQVLQKIEKALGWGGFDDKLPLDKVVVVLKHMFTLDELAEDLTLGEDLETDVTAECGKLGAIEKVRVFKTNPEGVITVKYKEEEPALKCVTLMNGRWFGGRQVVAHMYDGFTNYAVKVKESEEEQATRLEQYRRDLEAKQLAKLEAGAAAAAVAEGPDGRAGVLAGEDMADGKEDAIMRDV